MKKEPADALKLRAFVSAIGLLKEKIVEHVLQAI